MNFVDLEGCIGVDIGGQSIRVGAVKNGELEVITFVTPSEYEKAELEITASAKKLCEGSPKALGIGTPGPIDWRTGVLEWTPNIPWKNVHYFDLGAKLACPVYVDNDANVAGLAEAHLGAGKGYSHVAGYTLGTGIGFFSVQTGKIHHGKLDVEGGHIIINPYGPKCGCGANGCLEAYISASGIMNRMGIAPSEIESPLFWDEIARLTACGIINTNLILNPEVFILCGGITKRGEMLLEPLTKHVQALARILPPPEIKLAELGLNAGLIGALTLAVVGHRH